MIIRIDMKKFEIEEEIEINIADIYRPEDFENYPVLNDDGTPDLDATEELRLASMKFQSVLQLMPDGDIEGEVKEYEKMESAWADDEEIKEAGDVSGVQGIYGAMKPAYDFDSEGPGKAGPYQHSQYNEGETDEQYLPKHEWNKMKRRQDAEKSGEDFETSECR